MNQVQVKWVNPKDLHDEKPVWDKAELFVIPVVPLSALREFMEGIRDHILTAPFDGCNCKSCHYYNEITRLLAGLGEE